MTTSRKTLLGLFLLISQAALAQTAQQLDIGAVVNEMLATSDAELAEDLMRNHETAEKWKLFSPSRPVYKQDAIFKHLRDNGMESQFLEKMIRMSHIPSKAVGETGPALATWEFFIECCSKRIFNSDSPYAPRLQQAFYGEALANIAEDPNFTRINFLNGQFKMRDSLPYSAALAENLAAGFSKALAPSASADQKSVRRQSGDLILRLVHQSKDQKLFLAHTGVQEAFLKGIPDKLSFDKYGRPTNDYTSLLLNRNAVVMRHSESMRLTLLEAAKTKPHIVAALLAQNEFEHFRKNPELNTAIARDFGKFDIFNLQPDMRKPALSIRDAAVDIARDCRTLVAALKAQAKAANAKK